jgi:RNA:NAD 2'-phosphotransferase (TPT1/KptA family)
MSTRRPDSLDVQLSKTLAYLLRHGAVKGSLRADFASQQVKYDELAFPTWKTRTCNLHSDSFPLPEKLPIRADGYIAIAEILKHKNLKKFTAADIDRVVASNDKQRFAIDVVDGQQCIRANQGHSISAVAVETKKITALADLPTPVVVHGTYKRFWAAIKQTGLSRMNRNHIHFAIGTPESEQVISGMNAI